MNAAVKRGPSLIADARGDVARRPRRRALALIASGVLAPGLTACGKQSILSTHSKPAHDIALLWWWMLAAAVIVFAGAVSLLVIAWFRRDTPGLPFFGQHEGANQGM